MLTIIVEPPCQLVAEGKALRLEQDGNLIRRVPFYQIDCLMIRGKVQLCANVLRQSAAHAIPVLITASRAGTDAAWVTPGQQPSVMLRIAQHRILAKSELTLELSRRVVQAKLNGYRLALRVPQTRSTENRFRQGFESRLARSEALLLTATDTNVIRGIEGHVARAWFNFLGQQLFAHWEFKGRNRQPPKDPVNALLSFTYTLIQADVRGALQLRGFDSDIGFLHTPSPARASLVLDVLEPLRPLADCLVLDLCQTSLHPKQFNRQRGGACRLGKEARQIYFGALTKWRQGIMEALERPFGRNLWPQTPLPDTIVSLADLCRHLAHHLSIAVLSQSQTDEEAMPAAFADSDASEEQKRTTRVQS